MRKEIRGECSVFDCHTCCYPDKVKLYCQMTPNMKWQTACFFHKTQIHNQSCCLMKRKMNQCVFLAGLQLQLSRFKRGKSYFGISPQLSVSPKLVSLQFPNCVKTLLGNTMPFHGKIYQGRVFWECWLPYLLLPWLFETVLSDDFPTTNGKEPVSFRPLK